MNLWGATMINDYEKTPCVIKSGQLFYKTTKPDAFFKKHRELLPETTEIFYIDSNISERNEIDKALSILEKTLKGEKIKEVESIQENKCSYVYRLNQNTILSAYTKEQFELLKKWYSDEISNLI